MYADNIPSVKDTQYKSNLLMKFKLRINSEKITILLIRK